MKLIGTNLTTEQSQILFYLQLFSVFTNLIDPRKVEIDRGYEETQSFNVGGFNFSKDEGFWIVGEMIQTSSGSYWEPPDFDFAEIYIQESKTEHLSNFVINTLAAIMKDRCDILLSNEAEAAAEYADRQLMARYTLPKFTNEFWAWKENKIEF